MNDLLRKAMRFSPDIIAVAEMRGAEAMTAQGRPHRTCRCDQPTRQFRKKSVWANPLHVPDVGHQHLHEHSHRFVAEAFPIMVFKRQFPDGTRRIMEIVEATGVRDGVVQARTLFRFEGAIRSDGRHIRKFGHDPAGKRRACRFRGPV
jgi:pilus assembly protein CpaF